MEKRGRHKVGAYMTPMPHAIEPHMPLSAAEQRMLSLKVLHLPVRAAGRVVGIVSERDILLAKSLPGATAAATEVAQVMSEAPYSVGEDTPLAEVCSVMADNKYGAALVTDDQGHLLGIFTTTDALQALASITKS